MLRKQNDTSVEACNPVGTRDRSCGAHNNVVHDWLSLVNEIDVPTLEAIQVLHRQMDDNKDGNVDISESDEFLREELQYNKGHEKRHTDFHKNNDDTRVSVTELWTKWVNSQVRNWTVQQTADWVALSVELPQYREKFMKLKINGSYLPLFAVNRNHVLNVYLGIRDVIEREKLSLKSKDVVLFGPPKDLSSATKDIIFSCLMLAAACIIYWVYCRNVQMSKDLHDLKKSEELLRSLQKELEQAKQVQENQNAAQNSNNEADRAAVRDVDELIQLREEVAFLRKKLHVAQVELQLKRWIPPPELTQWLQETYKLEMKEHIRKQIAAEELLAKASKACEKFRKKQSNILNAFFPVHSRIAAEVDTAVLNAETALKDLLQQSGQRKHRWNQLEILLNPESETTSISVVTPESWLHAKSSVVIDENQNLLQIEDKQEEHKVICSRIPTERKYQSWQKVKRLLSLNNGKIGQIRCGADTDK